MDVLFINPALKEETQHPVFTSLVLSSVPLGLGYIAGYLRQENNLKVKIIDEVVALLSDSELAKELNSLKEPAIVGISCLTATYSRALELANKIKQIKPHSFVIFGGAHPTALPQESLNTGVVDIVVRQEGEITMKEIYDVLNFGKDLAGVKGLSYLKNGVIHHNPDRELVNLDILSKFPYDLFENNIKKYSDFGLILTSRGCPFDCIFCSNRIVTGKTYRAFSTERVIEQIKELVFKYKQKSIIIGDDNIMVDKRRFFDLSKAIIREGLHNEAFFSAQFRGRDMEEEVLQEMKKINFRVLSCGIETSSEQLMKLIDKKETVSEVKKGIETISAKGFLTNTTFIFGLPTETRQDRINSARLSRRLPLDNCRFNIAIPYPGTKLFEIAKKENRLHIAKDWRNFNVQYYVFGDDIPYFPESSGKFTLMADTMWSNIRFYFRLEKLIKIILRDDLISIGGTISLLNRKKTLRLYVDILKAILFVSKRFIYLNLMALIEQIKRE